MYDYICIIYHIYIYIYIYTNVNMWFPKYTKDPVHMYHDLIFNL